MFRLSKWIRRALLGCAICWACFILICYKGIVKKQVESERIEAVKLRHSQLELTIVCNAEIILLHDKDCVKRFKWIKKNWKTKPCFHELGVREEALDGEETLNCTTLRYLKYVERTCAHIGDAKTAFTKLMPYKTLDKLLENDILPTAQYRTEIQGLLTKFDECGQTCLWMRNRAVAMEIHFADALNAYAFNATLDGIDVRNHANSNAHKKRRKLNILIHMGLLTKEYGLNFGERALTGGPSGELVQWSDLMMTLYLLGHDLTLSWDPDMLKKIVNPTSLIYDTCRKARIFDYIYTDITGLEQLRTAIGTIYHYKCKLRILDVYGTEPEYNHPKYTSLNLPGQTWGGKGLIPRQFMTHYPHSPDNSFLGFVVVKGDELSAEEEDESEGKALIYGKRPEYMTGMNKIKFLNLLPNYFSETHATVVDKSKKDYDNILPEFIKNHGPLSQIEFVDLLRKSQIYVGMGLPYEGPAALEAIANGVTYFNPKFDPPRHAFDNKPTSRKLSSQNPYMEQQIGEPHVYTVDIKNIQKVEEVLKEIRTKRRPIPKVPVEFTAYGFIQRVNAYVENQEFCDGELQTDVSTGITWLRDHVIWPPLGHLEVKISNKGETCTQACRRHKMTCESSYFKNINDDKTFTKLGLICNLMKRVGHIENNGVRYKKERAKTGYLSPQCHAPSVDSMHSECTLQDDHLLFSCACTPPSGTTRLCPCRKYQYEQIALCEDCS